MHDINAEHDVVILGSGCAALTAALHAASNGLSVLVCEKSARLGGTSAMSAGGIWVPANHHEIAQGIDDTPDAALEYIAATAPEGWNDRPLWRSLVDAGPAMLRMIEACTPLRFRLTKEPDPFPEAPGSRPFGRMVSPLPISRFAARNYAFKVRGSTLPEIFTYHEVIETDLYHKPVSTTLSLLPRLVSRLLTFKAGKGTALMVGLVRGCLDHGVTFLLNAQGVEITMENGRATGAIIEYKGKRQTVSARIGTLIATGGFEWNPDMMQEHFPGPLQFFGGVASNTGDGHRMAQAAGAKLARMTEANITAAIPRRYEGRIHGMPVPYHAEPNAMVINQHGQRFVNELYINIGAVLNERDPETGMPVHLPAYVISDASYLRQLPLVRFFSRLMPGWLVKARSIDELAAKIHVDPIALKTSVERFNQLAMLGEDLDFGRGKFKAQQKADKRKKLGLKPIERAPFIAVSFNRSIMATKGGPRTNEYGEALTPAGTAITGLYCAGASMANPIGSRGVGAGTTLGPFMSWGYVCADHMLKQARELKIG